MPRLPKGVEVIPGGDLMGLLQSYGKCGRDGRPCTGEDVLIGQLVRELAWRRGALTAPKR